MVVFYPESLLPENEKTSDLFGIRLIPIFIIKISLKQEKKE